MFWEDDYENGHEPFEMASGEVLQRKKDTYLDLWTKQ